MAFYATLAGRKVLIQAMAQLAATVKLYQWAGATFHPGDTSTYTEATFFGYSAQSISGSGWNTPTGGNLQPTTIAYSSPLTFTCTLGGQPIGGYYVVDRYSNVLWSEPWNFYAIDQSYYIMTQGATITFTPTLTLSTYFA